MSLVFCIDYSKIKKIQEIEPFPFEENQKFSNLWMSILDTAISAQTTVLAAESLGLKSVYVGNIIDNMVKVSELLELPKYVIPSIMLTLGYPKSISRPTNKYKEEIIVHENTYKNTSIENINKAYKEKYSDWKMKSKDNLVKTIYETSKDYKDEIFAKKCVEYIKEKKHISPYQYWFGCYYLDDDFMKLEDYINFMYKKGFYWI